MYISKYSNNKEVSSAQYITELICENKAVKDRVDLHYRFWTTKKWNLYYRNQIASAHKLLERFTDKAIIAALRDIEARKIYSLRAPHLIPIIEKHEQILQNQNTSITIDLNRDNKISGRQHISKSKNIISKLKELDNGN